MKPGIYSDISNADYHGGPGVSKSMLDVLAERSPLHLRAMLDAANDNEPTAAQAFGTAFHAMILEPAEFVKNYCLSLRPSDVPGVIESKDQLVAMVEALNLSRLPKLPTGGSKGELVDRILSAQLEEEHSGRVPPVESCSRAELEPMKADQLKDILLAYNERRPGLLSTSGTIDQLAAILRDNGMPVTLWRDVKEEWLKNNGHRIVLESEQFEQLHHMREAVMTHPAARALLTSVPGKAEQSVYWRDEKTGVLCRCRPDWWRADGVIVDVKSTEDASPEGFAKSVANWRYHVQHPFYMDGVNAALQQAPKPDWLQADSCKAFVFLAVEKSACVVNGVAKGVAVYMLDDAGSMQELEDGELPSISSVELGRALYRRALDTFAQCEASNIWPGYSERIQQLRVPAFEFSKNAHVIRSA